MKRKARLVALAGAVVLAGVAGGVGYWQYRETVAENRELDVATGYWKSGQFAEALPRLWSLAANGNKTAHQELAYLYSSGLGVSRDRELARALYLKSQSDYAATFHHLGKLFDGSVSESGRQIERDEREALYWYYAAAIHGHPAAQQVLSQAYRDGTHGLARDPAKAAYWRKLSESK